MNDFVGNIMQNKFYACCYDTSYYQVEGTRPKRRCTPICGAALLLLVPLVPLLLTAYYI